MTAHLTDRDILIAAGAAILTTDVATKAFGLYMARELTNITRSPKAHTPDSAVDLTALQTLEAQNAALRREVESYAALAGDRLIEMNRLAAVVADRDAERAALREEIRTRQIERSALKDRLNMALAAATVAPETFPPSSEAPEISEAAEQPEPPAPTVAAPEKPAVQRVAEAYNQGIRGPNALSAATGVPKGSIHAQLSHARNRGLITPDVRPSEIQVSQASEESPVATADEPAEAARSDSRSSPEDGRENAGQGLNDQELASEPSRSPGGSQAAGAAPIRLVIDFDDEEVEGPNGKSIAIARNMLDLIDALKDGRPRHLADLQAEARIPSKKIREKADLYRQTLMRIGIDITCKGDYAQLHDLTRRA